MRAGNGKRDLRGGSTRRGEKAADPGNGARALDSKNAAVAGAENFRLVGAENGTQPEQECSRRRTDLLDGSSCLDANRLILVGEEFNQMRQQVRFEQAAALHQGQGAGGAKGSGGVGTASPDRFELNVTHAAEKNGGVLMLECGQSAAQGIIGPGLRIGLDRVVEEALEGGKQLGD